MNNYKINYSLIISIKLLIVFCALIMPTFLSLNFGNKALASACQPDTNSPGAATSDACKKEHIQDYLANQKCTDASSGSADSMERAFTKCKEDLADDASSIFESCKSSSGANAELACWIDKAGADDPPGPADNVDDTELEAASDSLRTPDASAYGGVYNIIIIVLKVLGALAGVAIVGSLVVAGVQYATAGDNSGAISKAKTRIAYTIIALVVYAMMYYVAVWLIPS